CSIIVRAATALSTLSLHDALPILPGLSVASEALQNTHPWTAEALFLPGISADRSGGIHDGQNHRGPGKIQEGISGSPRSFGQRGDRKSTRLNSSHLGISYAVFCLK